MQKAESKTEKSSLLCAQEQMGQQISEDENSVGQEGAQRMRPKCIHRLSGLEDHTLGSSNSQTTRPSLSQSIPPSRSQRERHQESALWVRILGTHTK